MKKKSIKQYTYLFTVCSWDGSCKASNMKEAIQKAFGMYWDKSGKNMSGTFQALIIRIIRNEQTLPT